MGQEFNTKNEIRRQLEEKQRKNATRNMLIYKSGMVGQFLMYFVAAVIASLYVSVEENGFLLFVTIYLATYFVVLIAFMLISSLMAYYKKRELYQLYRKKNFKDAYKLLTEKVQNKDDKKYYNNLRDLAVLEYFCKFNTKKAEEYMKILQTKSVLNYRSLFRLRQYIADDRRLERRLKKAEEKKANKKDQ